MNRLKQIVDNLMANIETEYDWPTNHPELGMKVPILDLAMWVEEIQLSSPGMDGQKIHLNCKDKEKCLPLGVEQALLGDHCIASNKDRLVTSVPISVNDPAS